MRHIRVQLRLAAAALVSLGTACAIGGGSAPSGPTGEPAATAEPPAVADSGSVPTMAGEIVVRGDLEARYVPAQASVSDIGGLLSLSLLQADGVSGVQLFFPPDIQAGSHPIGDLFHMADDAVTARYDSAGEVKFYESTSGVLELSREGDAFSGAFTFTAVRTPEGQASITVEGSFESVGPGD